MTSEEATAEQSPMRRVLGNLTILLRGRGVAAILLLATTALMARALGPVEFGLVVLIHTYAVLMRGLFNVKQFLGLIRYGVPALDSGDLKALRRLTAVCWRIDRLACICATVLAVGLAPLIGPYMDMQSDHVTMMSLYGLTLLATGNRTAVGILRLFDRYDLLSTKEIVGPAVRLLGIVFAWWFDSPMVVYVGIFAVAYVMEEMYLVVNGRREFKHRVGEPGECENAADAKLSEFSGLKQFLWVTYWQSNLDLIPQHGSILLAGFILGAAEAGLLRLARQFSTLLSKLAGLIRQVVFPDLTRAWNEGSSDFRLIVYRTALWAGSVGLVFVAVGHFFGETLLVLFVGSEYSAAAPILTLLLLAATFDLVAASMRQAAYAIGYAGKVLRMYAVSAAVYIAAFIVLTQEVGLVGAGMAACLAALLPSLSMLVLVHRRTRAQD